MKKAALALCCLLALSTPLMAEKPPMGVYDCFGTDNITGTKFSLLSPDTYLSRGGSHGHYTFDEGKKLLIMTDGSLAGTRYLQESPYLNLRLLRADGSVSHFNCPINKGKDPNKPNAW